MGQPRRDPRDRPAQLIVGAVLLACAPLLLGGCSEAAAVAPRADIGEEQWVEIVESVEDDASARALLGAAVPDAALDEALAGRGLSRQAFGEMSQRMIARFTARRCRAPELPSPWMDDVDVFDLPDRIQIPDPEGAAPEADAADPASAAVERLLAKLPGEVSAKE